MAVSKGHAALAAARREQKNIRKRKKMRQEITEIAGEGFAYAKGQYDVSQTAWDEYEAGYKEVTGEDYTGERGGWFSKPEGQVRVGERMYSRESLADIGRFKQTLGESPEGLYNYDKIMSRYKEMNLSGRDMTPEEVEKYRPQRPKIKEEYDVDKEFPMTDSKKSAWDVHKDLRGGKSKYFADEAAFKARKISTPSEKAGLMEIGKDWKTYTEPTAPSTQPYMVSVRDEYSAVGGTDYIPDNEVLNKPSVWSKFKGGAKKVYDWEKERQVGIQQRRSERMGFGSQNTVTPQSEGQIFKDGKPTSSLSQTYNNNFARNYNEEFDMWGNPVSFEKG